MLSGFSVRYKSLLLGRPFGQLFALVIYSNAIVSSTPFHYRRIISFPY